jgi:hypothetical protein
MTEDVYNRPDSDIVDDIAETWEGTVRVNEVWGKFYKKDADHEHALRDLEFILEPEDGVTLGNLGKGKQSPPKWKAETDDY